MSDSTSTSPVTPLKIAGEMADLAAKSGSPGDIDFASRLAVLSEKVCAHPMNEPVTRLARLLDKVAAKLVREVEFRLELLAQDGDVDSPTTPH